MTCSAPSGRGVFITFEGGDGAGKTTHIRFLASILEAQGHEVLCLREPGGTVIGEKLRAILLNPAHAEMAPECELFIYEAARAQIVSQVIKPALERGAVVLCDRFYDSTLAYQVHGRGLDESFARLANGFACRNVHPDRTILMVPPSARDGLRRATKNDGADRIEQAGCDFHERVRQAFTVLAEAEPQRVRTVHSADKKSETSRKVFAELTDLFPWFQDMLADPEAFSALDAPSKGGARG